MGFKIKQRIKRFVKTQRQKARERKRFEAEVGAISKKAEQEAYRKERIKQAKKTGRARGRQRARGGGGGLLATLGTYGQKAQKMQSEMFGVPSVSGFDFFGSPRKKTVTKRKRGRR